jgi:MarR family transcriptional regulator, transcriptional regulator for hemolysin
MNSTSSPATAVASSLGYLLTDTLRLLRRDFHTRTQGLGLTPALARLLYYVHRRPGWRQADLAALLDVSPVTLGRMIDRLAHQQYIRREADSRDRRVTRIYVDQRAEPVLSKMVAVSTLTQQRAMQGLDEAERAQLFDLLARVQGNLSKPL